MQQRNPNAVSDGFVPARLTLARNARGMKQVELAAAIGRTPATISKWESNAYGHTPDKADLEKLADGLSVQVGWFYKPIIEYQSASFFRSLRSEIQIAREKTAAKICFVNEIFFALKDRVEFPPVDIPNLTNGDDYRTFSVDKIERIASNLREYWGLGDDPIDDIMLVIENAGVAVAEDYVASTKLDGVSRWFGEYPVILLAKDKNGGVRRRFDAAHELGHLVLHRDVTPEQLTDDLALIEEQAMAFAGAFLLPEASFSSDINNMTLDELADIKPTWKVSIAAMIKRMRALNLVASDHERNLWKYYSYRKWRGNEPYDDRIEIERPVNLMSAFEMIHEDGSSAIAALMAEIGLSVADVSDLTGVSPEFLGVRQSPQVKLKLVRREGVAVPSLDAAND